MASRIQTRIETPAATILVTPTGLKIGTTKAKVQTPAEALKSFDKGTRRSIRKQLQRSGRADLARASVVTA